MTNFDNKCKSTSKNSIVTGVNNIHPREKT